MKLLIGQFSDKGKKSVNQDFHGYIVPNEPQQTLKGNAFAIADGISSSNVSQVASETAVKNFIEDYFSTSDAWSAKTAGIKVIKAINGWLAAQTLNSEYRFNKDKGYVCTLSALVLKAQTAHIFHVGDSRIYRVRDGKLEQLTKDHRAFGANKESYLSRAIGVNTHVDVDYYSTELKPKDYFLICTDGIFEYWDKDYLLNALNDAQPDLSAISQTVAKQALKNGSADNLTLQIVGIDTLAASEQSVMQQQIDSLPLPPLLTVSKEFDGYRVRRELHANSRSHVYLAEDIQSKELVVIKIPSVELRDNPAYLERFLMEEWAARKINSNHVMKAGPQDRQRNYLYSVLEYIDGISLKQWLLDNPTPDLAQVRSIVEQIAKGLMAMHRKEIIHQDLRPENIMIDHTGTVKIIDFGGARVAGLSESNAILDQEDMQGTALYMAPEYFVGECPTSRSDLYSLAVITYHMLSGEFPYGTAVVNATTTAAQRKLNYQSVLDDERATPMWVDLTLKKALAPDQYKRYGELSEFIFDLSTPNTKFIHQTRPPLIERKPLYFWKSLSLLLAMTIVGLLVYIEKLREMAS